MQDSTRSSFTTNLGFILSAAGAAVGLGNIWRFPYLAGSSGGGYFLMIYLVIGAVFGISLVLAESSLGRSGQGDSSKSFYTIAERMGSPNAKKWAYAGFIGILCSFVITAFYLVIGGWVIEYMVKSFTVPLSTLDTSAFAASVSQTGEPIFYTFIFWLCTFIIIMLGVEKGIEKASKIMLPALFVLLVIVVIRAVTLPGAVEGLKFLFIPNVENMQAAGGFGKITLAALGQCFFSMSLGQGILITYGSYLKKNNNLMTNAVAIPVLDTAVALLAGMAVLPVVFAYGMEPTAGTGLLFGTLPLVFDNFGAIGPVFCALFFLLVFFAALTSSIAMSEVCVCFMIDTFKMSRKQGTFIIGGLLFLLSVICSLSNGALSWLTIGGMNIFDAFGWLADKILLPGASLMVAVFIGYVWLPENAKREITNEGTLRFSLYGLWAMLMKYIVPIGIVVIFVTGLIS